MIMRDDIGQSRVAYGHNRALGIITANVHLSHIFKVNIANVAFNLNVIIFFLNVC